MNTKTEGAVVEQEGETETKTQEQIAQEEAEAERAFSDGVSAVRGEEPTPPGDGDDKGEKKPEAKPETKPAAQATGDEKVEAKPKVEAPAKDPWEGVPPVVRDEFRKLGESVTSQISKLAGHIGGFKRQFDSFVATASAAAKKEGADAPTKIEIAEALADPEKFEQLKKDFPEWMEPIAAEFTRLRQDMAKVAKRVQEEKPAAAPAEKEAIEVDSDAIVAEAEERAYVRLKHPDWKAICADPEFAKKDADGKIVGGWLATQSDEIRKKADSEKAEDAIEVFDAWKAHKKKLADDKAAAERKEKRLSGAIPAKGAAEPPEQGLSDEDAFNVGVQSTLRKK